MEWTYNHERPRMALGGITPKQKLAFLTKNGGITQQLIKVRLEQAVLHDAVLFKLAFRVRLGNFGSDFSGILQNGTFIKFQKQVEALRPVLHGHRDIAFGAFLGQIKIGFDDTSQRFQLLL